MTDETQPQGASYSRPPEPSAEIKERISNTILDVSLLAGEIYGDVVAGSITKKSLSDQTKLSYEYLVKRLIGLTLATQDFISPDDNDKFKKAENLVLKEPIKLLNPKDLMETIQGLNSVWRRAGIYEVGAPSHTQSILKRIRVKQKNG